MSVFQQTLRQGGSRDEIMQAVGGRITALATAENLLSLSCKSGAELAELIGKVVNPLTPSPARLVAICPKYGAWSNDTGYVGITCDKTAGNLIFQWHEHDGPPVSPSGKEGLGSKLIRCGIPNAQVDHALKPNGVVCRIELALAGNAKVEVSTDSPIEATHMAKRQAS